MNTETQVTPRIFLTDYASYNAGTQFEFGHWVDLDDFSDIDELNDYIRQHFKEADQKSPLDGFGSIREEIMVTDYEGFPEQLYCECGSTFESIFNWMYLESNDRAKVEYLMEWQGASFSDALESFEDVILWEYSGSKSDAVFYIFHELYPDVETIERQNDFLTVDYDRFEDQCLIDFADSEGNEYLVLRE